MALTKNDLISKLVEQTELDNKTAARSVEAIIEIMKSAMESGDDLLISGFGKFCVNEKNIRKGRNPATGDAMMLPAKKVITFKCSGKLRDRINKKK
jgi:integration host factor subunit alpha